MIRTCSPRYPHSSVTCLRLVAWGREDDPFLKRTLSELVFNNSFKYEYVHMHVYIWAHTGNMLVLKKYVNYRLIDLIMRAFKKTHTARYLRFRYCARRLCLHIALATSKA